jgi:hypothetical protein
MRGMNVKVINAKQTKNYINKDIKLKLLKGVILIENYTTYLCIYWYIINISIGDIK